MTVKFTRAKDAKILFYITQVDGFRKLIGRFGRDMINAGYPHQITGSLDTFDTFDHNVRRILNRTQSQNRTQVGTFR
ncbi:MAG: hypothetical protein WCE96_01485 [Nitrososphaeraceae archaeon]